MKSILAFAILCFISLAHTAGEKPGADAVIVKVLDGALPGQEAEMDKHVRL